MPLKLIRNDITKVKADAIVNTANPDPVYRKGTDSAVYQKAGIKSLLARRKKIGRIKEGEAAITPAFNLEAQYIIYTVGPVWQGGGFGEERKLRLCYRNSLRLAKKHECESVAFPLISTGTYGFPKAEGLRIALSEIGDFLLKEEMLVYLVVFDREAFELSGRLYADIDSYIDENYVSDKLAEEYSADREREDYCGNADGLSASFSMGEVREDGFTAAMPSVLPQEPEGRKESCKKNSRGKQKAAARSLEDVMAQLGETFQERLFRLIDERNLTDVQVYKKANLDRKLFSKIRCNPDYRPKKNTALALAVALELNLDETKDLLSRAEIALSPSSRFDLIITYFIEMEIYDIYTINLALFQYHQDMLGV